MSTLPVKLKAIQPFLKVANDMRKKNPIIAYYCDLHAMQMGLKIDSKSPDCKTYLIRFMDALEMQKKTLISADPENTEQISSEVVGQAALEQQAGALFQWADNKDRKSEFGKNVVRAFYTSSVLYDVAEGLCGEENFGEESKHHRKYARWKATYIHNCLKNGETPQPGPVGGLEDEWEDELEAAGSSGIQQPDISVPVVPPPAAAPSQPEPPKPVARSKPAEVAPPANIPSYTDPTPAYTTPSGGVELTPIQYNQAQKLCKYASSAIMYQDVPTALLNLEKCMRLLKTGKE